MNIKKAILLVCALALVCAVSVAGTFAFLKEESNTVNNTFVAEGGGKIIDDDPSTPGTEGTFEIIEKTVAQNEDGTYSELDSTTTSGNSYDVLPGLELPKTAYIDITGKTTVPAYLYLEVISSLTDGVYTYTVDSNNWAPVKDKGEQVTGANGGLLYVYVESGSPAILAASDADKYTDSYSSIGILDGDKVTIADDVDESTLASITSDSLSFNAYLAQASAGDNALEAYDACFGN